MQIEDSVKQAVLVPSVDISKDAKTVKGYDFNKGRCSKCQEISVSTDRDQKNDPKIIQNIL